MKIAIIADSHDHLEKLEIFLDYLKDKEIEKIIHLGDVCKIEYLKTLSLIFPGEIFLVRGNADLYETEELRPLSNIKYFDNLGDMAIDKVKIAFVHEPEKIKRLIKNYQSFNFIFHGHTHKPWLKKDGDTIIANPGNLSGIGYAPTFAILDTTNKNLELKLLEEIQS